MFASLESEAPTRPITITPLEVMSNISINTKIHPSLEQWATMTFVDMIIVPKQSSRQPTASKINKVPTASHLTWSQTKSVQSKKKAVKI